MPAVAGLAIANAVVVVVALVAVTAVAAAIAAFPSHRFTQSHMHGGA